MRFILPSLVAKYVNMWFNTNAQINFDEGCLVKRKKRKRKQSTRGLIQLALNCIKETKNNWIGSTES